MCAAALILLSAVAVQFFYFGNSLLDYGDAEAHLDIARRIIDSRTPGYDQIGSVWLPLPHWLMLPFVRHDDWWRSGMAGAFPSAGCFVIGGCFLFLAARRAFQSTAAAWSAAALCALNPNLLYLQSTPMSEPVFFACLAALLYFTVCFRLTGSWLSVIGAGVAGCAATLTRYEGWFLLPFVAVYLLIAQDAGSRRLWKPMVFCLIAGLGPVYWLFHHWWLSGDPLAFYRGPYSAHAIRLAEVLATRSNSYPGHGDWRKAFLFFGTAVQLCASTGLVLAALGGAIVALIKRVFWPLVLLALPGIFYLWTIHSDSTPVYVPSLWYGSYYNLRYALSVLPLLAVAASALVALVPSRARAVIAILVIAAGTIHWFLDPRPEAWAVWQESRINDAARREAAREAADYLKPLYVQGSGIFTTFGAIAAIYRQMGIPLRDTLTWDNGLPFDATASRPDLYLTTQWAVALAGDPVDNAISRAHCCTLEKSIPQKDAPEIHIYRRTGDKQ